MINIEAQDYNKIISVLGYPVVKEDDLELTKNEILVYLIEPVVRKYYSWFPLKKIESKMIGTGNFEFEFPDDDVFSCVDVRLNPESYGINTRSVNPFINQIYYNKNTYASMYGTPYDYGVEAAKYLERAYDLSKLDQLRAIRFDIDMNRRILSGFSNDRGELLITWAKMSNDFNKIPINRKDEVIELCQAEILNYFAMLRSQIQTGTNVDFNVDGFTSRAKDLEDRVMNKWKALSKTVIIRA